MKRELFSRTFARCGSSLLLFMLVLVAANSTAHAQSGMLQRGTVAAAHAVSTPEAAVTTTAATAATAIPDQKTRQTEERNARPSTTTEQNNNDGNARTVNANMANATPSQPVAAPTPVTTATTVPTSSTATTNSNAATVANNNNATATSVATTTAPANVAAASSTTAFVAATDIYRVGAGDVLDIRISNQTARESTLYTVQEGGMLEYPLIGEPTKVAGMSPEQIGARIEAELKRRAVFPDAKVIVNVRDYQSHTVIISGMVDQPGTKFLRRDAVPLYVVLAEAQPRLEAGRAIITSRQDGQKTSVDFSNQAAMSTLVRAGDFIQVGARPPQYFFIGGQIGVPGQKDFHGGMTLTQAIIAAGGTTRFATGRARISRQGADGKLVSTEYNLSDIEKGKTPDPILQAGDRIEIGRTRW